jgi:hypothetical protein
VRPIAVVEPLLLGAVPNSEYWATIAQVLPVLGLAIVLEARTISQRWTPETPKWLRFTQSLIWVVPLVLLAIGESAALRALRGVQVWPWWTLLMEITISAAISVLFLAPALELLTKGYAEAAARIMTGGWLPRLRLALLEHREYRQHRKLHTLRAWLWQHLNWHEAVDRIIASGVARLRTLAETSESPQKEEAEEELREAIAGQQHAALGHEDAREMYRETVRFELELTREFREDKIVRRRQLSEARAAERHRVFQAILADTTHGADEVAEQLAALAKLVESLRQSHETS